ncbi:MAG: ATP-dependent DNA helicase RecQ, partial [Chloroflexia bacterium]|nr:ATP-dependent DNA helicase RecQ [Chloroflexia bacterium]
FAGDIARAAADMPAARGHYDAILGLVPDNVGALAGLCRLAILAHDRARAIALIDRLTGRDEPLGAGQLLTIATLMDWLDQPSAATTLRHRALRLEAEYAHRLAAEVDAALGRSERPGPPIGPRARGAPTNPAGTSVISPKIGGVGADHAIAPVLEPITESTAEVPVDPRVIDILRRDFGYEQLRAGQAAVIANVIAGRDTLAIMPTGAGKSLTFQIPAIVREGITLVLSPLIALMKDQFDSLPPAIQARTALLNSSQPADEQRRVMHGLAAGEYKMIYAAPERLRQYSFLAALRAGGTSLVVVDEAHCISLWGHDFRPDYLTIPFALRELGNPPLLAITATATTRMAAGIKEGFGRELAEIRTSVFRANLFYEAHALQDREQKVQRAVEICRAERGAGIVYVRSRKDAEAIAGILRDRGVGAVPYHAGLDSTTRGANQERFMSDQARVVVATTAFGMGVNKADVRFIIHLSPTPSLEAYAQESGRAGRDGQAARCVLLATKSDRGTLTRMARRDAQAIDTLRRIYAGLKQAATGAWAIVAPDSLLRWQPLDPEADDEADPRIALGLLSQAKLVKRHADMPVSYTIQGIQRPAPDLDPPPDPLWPALAAWLDPGATDLPTTVRTNEALQALGCTPDELVRVLSSLPGLSVREGPRQACFELLPAGADAAMRIEQVLARVRQDADARIQQVLGYVQARRCRHVLLANHLGEGLANCDVSCDICHPAGATTAASQPVAASERSSFTADDAMEVLEAIRSLSFALGKPGLTKFLLGSVESRVRADRSPSFGRLAGMRKSVVERLIDKLLEDGFIEHYLDREYRLLRLTQRGRHAQPDDLAGYDSRQPLPRSAGSPNGDEGNGASADDEDLFHRLRAWRRERAGQDAVPPYVVSSDQGLRAVAEMRPHDAATLLDVPGFGPAKVEKYGPEILAVIAGVPDSAPAPG